MILTIFLLVTVLCVGIIWGRAVEASKRDQARPTAFNLNAAQRQGYLRARIDLDPNKTLTLDETLLVLHRLEGILGAVNDNFSELHLMVKKYGAETDA